MTFGTELAKSITIRRKYVVAALSPKRKKLTGWKKRAVPFEEIKALPFHKRGTVRSVARAINFPRSTLQDHIKKYRELKWHSNAIKSYLTERNKVKRLQYSLSKIDPESLDEVPQND